MGDLGDYWREHREYRRSRGLGSGGGGGSRRRARLVSFTKEWERLGFRKCSDWHWQATINDELLDYWPSKQKWRYRGVNTLGTERELKEFVRASKDQPTPPRHYFD